MLWWDSKYVKKQPNLQKVWKPIMSQAPRKQMFTCGGKDNLQLLTNTNGFTRMSPQGNILLSQQHEKCFNKISSQNGIFFNETLMIEFFFLNFGFKQAVYYTILPT